MSQSQQNEAALRDEEIQSIRDSEISNQIMLLIRRKQISAAFQLIEQNYLHWSDYSIEILDAITSGSVPAGITSVSEYQIWLNDIGQHIEQLIRREEAEAAQ